MAHDNDIDGALQQVQARLAAMADALGQDQAESLAAAAVELQRALEPLRRAGRLPPERRRQLAELAADTAAQRESVARASAGLQRAINVLLPGHAPGAAYAADGSQPRQAHSGWTRA
jgi:hypothetical protein